jgi:hypothetical protein
MGCGEWGGNSINQRRNLNPAYIVRKVNTGKFLLKEKEVFAWLFAKKNSG